VNDSQEPHRELHRLLPSSVCPGGEGSSSPIGRPAHPSPTKAADRGACAGSGDCAVALYDHPRSADRAPRAGSLELGRSVLGEKVQVSCARIGCDRSPRISRMNAGKTRSAIGRPRHTGMDHTATPRRGRVRRTEPCAGFAPPGRVSDSC